MMSVSPIVRTLYAIVQDETILCGKGIWCRFVPFSKVTQRDNVVTYESEAKAKAALEHKYCSYFNGSERIVPVDITMYVRI